MTAAWLDVIDGRRADEVDAIGHGLDLVRDDWKAQAAQGATIPPAEHLVLRLAYRSLGRAERARA